jgi:hypothetical protein
MITNHILRCNVTIVVGDTNSGEERVVDTHNLVTSAGRNLLRDLLSGDSTSKVSYMAIGHGTTAPVAGDTTLEHEDSRLEITLAHSDALGSVTFTVYWAAGVGTGTVSEAGLLTAAVVGTLYARTTFAPIVKTAAMYLRIIWECMFDDDEDWVLI